MAIGSTMTNRTPPTVGSTANPGATTTLNQFWAEVVALLEAKIGSASITPDADLSFLNYAITALGSLGLQNKSTAFATASRVYERSGELYFNDASGNAVKITSAGRLNAAALAGITGDYGTGPESVTYAVASTLYSLLGDTNKWAKLKTGDVLLVRAGETSPNAITIQPPTSLGAAYTLTLPATQAAANNSLLEVSTAGVAAYTKAPSLTSCTLTDPDVKHGTRSFVVPAFAAHPSAGTKAKGRWTSAAGADTLRYPLIGLQAGEVITALSLEAIDTPPADTAATLTLTKYTFGTDTEDTLETVSSTRSGAAQYLAITVDPAITVHADYTHYAIFTAGAASHIAGNLVVSCTRS